MFLPIGGDRCLRDPIGGVDHPLIQLNIRGGNACLDLIHFPHSLGIRHTVMTLTFEPPKGGVLLVDHAIAKGCNLKV